MIGLFAADVVSVKVSSPVSACEVYSEEELRKDLVELSEGLGGAWSLCLAGSEVSLKVLVDR